MPTGLTEISKNLILLKCIGVSVFLTKLREFGRLC
jgi:hypothetical protein